MTLKESLNAISAYPIPMRTIEAISLKRGVALDDEATTETVGSSEYNLAKADLYMWLYTSPNVSQGGQSYSFGDKESFRRLAHALYKQYGTDEDVRNSAGRYGYMGSRL